MGYVVAVVVIIGLAALAVVGTGGVAMLVLIPALRVLPIVSAILATVAVAVIAQRLDAGPLPAILFGAASVLVGVTYIVPYLPAIGRHFGWLWLSAPALTIVPAVVLWHLAKAMNQRG